MTEAEKQKYLCTQFFYWWYNQPGTATEQGYEQWLESDHYKEVLDTIPPRKNWIDVNDALPTETGEYLIAVDAIFCYGIPTDASNKIYIEVCVFETGNKRWWEHDENECNGKGVLYWMPLPQIGD